LPISKPRVREATLTFGEIERAAHAGLDPGLDNATRGIELKIVLASFEVVDCVLHGSACAAETLVVLSSTAYTKRLDG